MSPARNLVYFVLNKGISKPKLFISNHDLRKEGNKGERRREQTERVYIVGRAVEGSSTDVESQILLLRVGHQVAADRLPPRTRALTSSVTIRERKYKRSQITGLASLAKFKFWHVVAKIFPSAPRGTWQRLCITMYVFRNRTASSTQ
jgi:hypothetical protein